MIIKNKIKSDFSIVPNKLITSKLSHTAIVMYMYIASKPEIWVVNHEEIQKKLGISKNTMVKVSRELIESGWASRKKRNDGKYDYTLNSSQKDAQVPKSSTSQKVLPADVSTSQNLVCAQVPKSSTSQKMNPINNKDSLIDKDIISNIEENNKEEVKEKFEDWLQLIHTMQIGLSEDEKNALVEFANSEPCELFTQSQIKASLSKIKSYKLQKLNGISDAIWYSIERGLNYIAKPLPNQQKKSDIDVFVPDVSYFVTSKGDKYFGGYDA